MRGDVLDAGSYRKALEGCETVLHMAALTGKGSAEEHFRVNAEGTRTLVEECRKAGVRNFLHVSTISAKYPNLRYYHYGQAKRKAEETVAASGLRYAIVRPTMIFAKGAPVLEGLAKMAAGPLVLLMGDGRAKVQPVYAGDVARAIVSILEAERFDGSILELGGADVLTMRELLQRIRAARLGGPGRVLRLPVHAIAAVLAALERVALPLLPLTAGQLAAFRNDSTAAGDAAWTGPRKGIDEMLRLAAADAE